MANLQAIVKVEILGYFKQQLAKIFAPKDLVSTSKEGLMSKEDKKKLDGIQEGATNYQHPSTHPGSMITEDGTHRWTTDAEKGKWNDAKAKADAHQTALENMTLAKVNEICGKYHVGTSDSIE